MKAYDVTCPICKHLNRSLYMEETDGWMECERCKNSVQILAYAKMKKFPLYTGEQLAKLFAETR